jgi:ABC-type transport system involved in cytochrome c biogenesis permease component
LPGPLVLPLVALALGVAGVIAARVAILPLAGRPAEATFVATIALAATGTVYGVLVGGLRVRETLIPLLVLPAVTPVVLGGTRAFQAALDDAPGDAWPWVQLLGAFAVLAVAAGVVVFGPLLEEP